MLSDLYQSDVYSNGLKPLFEMVGNGISRSSAEQAPDWEAVLINRGKLQMLKWIDSELKHIAEKERKSS